MTIIHNSLIPNRVMNIGVVKKVIEDLHIALTSHNGSSDLLTMRQLHGVERQVLIRACFFLFIGHHQISQHSRFIYFSSITEKQLKLGKHSETASKS